MIYIEASEKLKTQPEMFDHVKFWMVQRNKSEFMIEDAEPFAYWLLARGLVANPPPKTFDLIQWAITDVVGTKATRSNQPNPYLRS